MRSAVRSFYTHVAKRLDDRVPDDLPIGAGAWLQEIAGEHCVGLRIYAGAPGTRYVDSYIPSSHVITLSRDVYVKKDPSYWAAAAHELGHAIVYRSSPLVYVPLQLGRFVLAGATSIATVLIFANVLYARADLDAIAFSLLYASLGGYALLLVDEALASVVGLRILRRDPRIDRRGTMAGAVALAAAFLTYVAGFIGQVLLVAQRRFVMAQIARHRHFVPGQPLGVARWAVVAILSALLVLYVARVLPAMLVSRKDSSPAALEQQQRGVRTSDFVRGFFVCALVALVYDQPGAPMLPLVCAAGIVASRTFVGALGSILEQTVRALVFIALAPFTIAIAIARLQKNPPPKKDPNVVPSPLASTGPMPGPLDALPLPVAIDDWSIEHYRNAPWHERVAEIAFPLLQVAFVIGVFVELLSR